jgi:hypothetical protein
MRTEHTTILSHKDIFEYGEKKLFLDAEDIILNYALVEWSINLKVREDGIEASIDIKKVSINWEVDGEEMDTSHNYRDVSCNVRIFYEALNFHLTIDALEIDFEEKTLMISL